jgi:hypothetical protein
MVHGLDETNETTSVVASSASGAANEVKKFVADIERKRKLDNRLAAPITQIHINLYREV